MGALDGWSANTAMHGSRCWTLTHESAFLLITVTDALKLAQLRKREPLVADVSILLTPLIHSNECMDASMFGFCSAFLSLSYIRPSFYITYMANAWLEMRSKKPLKHTRTQMRRKTHACTQRTHRWQPLAELCWKICSIKKNHETHHWNGILDVLCAECQWIWFSYQVLFFRVRPKVP